MRSERALKLAVAEIYFQGISTEKKPRLSTRMEEIIAESLTNFQFPEEHLWRFGTSKVLERLNKEIRRRSRIVGVFPNRSRLKDSHQIS